MSDPLEALGSLVLWTGVIVGALLLIRRRAQRGGRATPGQTALRVVARTALTRGSVAVVLEADGRRFLVGAADQRITLLSELEPDGDSLAALEHQQRTGSAPHDRSSVLPSGISGSIASAKEWRTSTPDRPWIGLLDRARALTVRTHVERPIRAPGS